MWFSVLTWTLCLAFSIPSEASVCSMVLMPHLSVLQNLSAPWNMLCSCKGRLCRYLGQCLEWFSSPDHITTATQRDVWRHSTNQPSQNILSLHAPHFEFCMLSLLHHNNESARSILRLHCLLATTNRVWQMKQKIIGKGLHAEKEVAPAQSRESSSKASLLKERSAKAACLAHWLSSKH